ncbi:hypothetical protein LTR10_022504 [Elasticomyces elasticus]|uniref:Uncharacterized protein n=1 Tax=Exophiala sideris TaxID=1016849 RepID=A0ABR0J7U3_9EURO|nr:hypothetical protein LTR10_022504 [Elasticomyces elasticus]KAK5029453.1 hypothetical protein LTS07_005915 [Exophiala sideris]KAK5036849.1 hypothetical protein LTR13_005229 [Exophiala sideris]KAK5058083.1 hypothetical protein LTR69_007080 [Exophiala sideris]KAK5182042.1 hypothetical protein LTR44_005643 [Eurotiomycetes sp. CCFEE 6388]
MTIALVTGASRGIGKAIALQLADDGMDVAVNDIQTQLAELEAVKTAIEQKDVSKEDEVIKMVESTVNELGELNVMIANAGIIVAKTMFEVSVEEWDRVQAVNVRGAFLCYREAGRQMIKQGKGGKIVGACSTAGHRPSGNTFAYGVSKWAVRGLTQSAAIELAKHDINVNGKLGDLP